LGSKFLAGNTDLGDAAFFMSGSINSKDLTGGAVSVFGGDLTVSGNLHASDYIYHLSDTDTFFRFSAANTVNVTAGNKALVDGTSTAGVVINQGGDADVDFRVESDNNQWMFFVDSNTNRIGIGKTGNAPATTVHIKDASPILRLQRNANGEDSTLDFAGEGGAIGAAIHAAGSNDLVFSTHDGSDQEEILRLGGHWGSDNRQVILLSGTAMGTGDMQPKEAADINFFVSGAMYSKNTAVKGTAVFGGDTVISGALYLDEIPASVPTVPDGTVALYGKDDSGVTKLYFKNEGGETEIGSGGGGTIDGSGAATRLTYWSDADTLTSDADLNFNGSNLGLTGSATGANSALDIDRNYSSTTSNSATDAVAASGILIDYDVTGIVGSSQIQRHKALWVKYDQSAPSHHAASIVQGTGLMVEMTGSTAGIQTIEGIHVKVENPGSLAADASRGISINAPAGWVDGTSARLTLEIILTLVLVLLVLPS
jgi:hypothetical protein